MYSVWIACGAFRTFSFGSARIQTPASQPRVKIASKSVYNRGKPYKTLKNSEQPHEAVKNYINSYVKA